MYMLMFRNSLQQSSRDYDGQILEFRRSTQKTIRASIIGTLEHGGFAFRAAHLYLPLCLVCLGIQDCFVLDVRPVLSDTFIAQLISLMLSLLF